MPMLDQLLSPIVIGAVAVAGFAAISVSVTSGFIRDRDLLNMRLHKTERALKKVQSEMADRQIRIKQLIKEVEALQPVERELREYYESLMRMQIAAEREALQEAATDEAESVCTNAIPKDRVAVQIQDLSGKGLRSRADENLLSIRQ